MKLLRKSIQFARYSTYFIFNSSGKEYGIFFFYKIYIVLKVILNFFHVKSLTDPVQQLMMIEEILRIPKSIKGDIVECGCYNGASTINLSMACAGTKRKLFVCDSFEGLPPPKEDEKYDIDANDSSNFYHWEEGEFTSDGGMEGVKTMVTKYGNISVCEFVKGYFCDSLKSIKTDSVVMVFEDADLASSVADCLLYLWPKLQEDCKFYCHEPWSVNVVALFYDKEWWRDNFSSETPGFLGSGAGIIKAGFYTNIGYAKKVNLQKIIADGQKKMHSGTKGFN